MALPDLIIQDIHEDIPQVERILANYLPKVRRVICLGDYWDSWTRSETTTRKTCHWIREALQDPRMDLLLGNHDLHYLGPGHGFSCSGYLTASLKLVQSEIPLNLRWKLQDPRGRVFLFRHGWLLSHAGLHPSFAPNVISAQPLSAAASLAKWLAGEESKALKQLRADGRGSSWLWREGWERGGLHPLGGPVWLGWEKFEDVDSLPPQIVGHTCLRVPSQRGRSWNLDTQLRYVGLLSDEGTFTVEAVP